MGAITGTKALLTEFSGEKKIVVVTATMAAASDTVTLTAAAHGITVVDAVFPFVTGGFDAAFMHVEASATDNVITLTAEENDGTAATDFTGTTVSLLIIGH